jgi:ubiquitin C-terminal hydrolase
MKIGRLPETMCITIRRNNIQYGGQAKINTHIDFPFQLDFAPYISEISPTRNCVYSLRAVIEHHGGVDGASGHYTTIRSNPVSKNTNWYFISDEFVKQISVSSVQKARAYMLFYEISS